MTIPFLNFFKKTAAPKPPIFARPTPVSTGEKPSGERMSKTVMPNTIRTVAPQEEFETVPPPAPQPRVYSLGRKATAELPPAVALALEPRIERVISLELRDVVGQMPTGWIRPISDAEAGRRVLLKAAEVEKGMASARPSVCLTSIYNQLPEIFLRPVSVSDQAQVPLPFAKVLEQFNNVQTRNDQSRDQTVPQLETPFLRVTLEDNTRFGTSMAPLHISEKPLVNMQLATAETIAAAQPELFVKPPPPPAPIAPGVAQLPITRAKDGSRPVIKLPVEELLEEESSPACEAETPPVVTPAPTRIPFKISPIGTGAPASERVPASSGPSVPSAPAPTRIAFKLPLASETKMRADLPNESKKDTSQNDGPKISLALKPIFMTLPPFQLAGEIKEIDDAARLEVPFSFVQPQLASGRVSIKASDFSAILPEQYRRFFSATEIDAPVILPLQDVLKNLPATTLRMRDDQEEQERGSEFKTPFSLKAAEDAKRLQPTESKPLKGMPQLVPVLKAEDSTAKGGAAEKIAAAPAEELDAKTVVANAGKMKGVKACAIMFGDGLSLAGNLPGEFQAEGLCAMAPSFLQRLTDHLGTTKLGELRAMTITCAKAAVTFFMHDNLCLAALHAKEELSEDVRERLAQIVQELSRKYSQPA